MNDGNRWVGNYSVELENRFSKKTKTIFITISPDSAFISILAEKVGTSTDSLREKIRTTRALLLDSYDKSQKIGCLEIYETDLFPTRSIFISENKLIETPYQTAKGRVKIPVYIYKKLANDSCIWSFANNDIKQLLKKSKRIPLTTSLD